MCPWLQGSPANLESMMAFIPLCGLLAPSLFILVLGLACCLSVLQCGWWLRRLRDLQACFRGECVCVSWSSRKGSLGVCLERQPRALCGEVLCTIMHLPPNCAPGSPTSLHTLRSTFQCRSHRKNSSSLSFIISFQSRITAAYVLGLLPAACGENSSPESVLLSRAELS